MTDSILGGMMLKTWIDPFVLYLSYRRWGFWILLVYAVGWFLAIMVAGWFLSHLPKFLIPKEPSQNPHTEVLEEK